MSTPTLPRLTHEEARRLKAETMAAAALDCGFTADTPITDEQWDALARIAEAKSGTRSHSLPSRETRALTLAFLRARAGETPARLEPKLCVRCRQPVATPDPVYMFPVHTSCLRDEPKPALPEGVRYVEDVRYQEWSGEPAAVEQAAAERVAWAASMDGQVRGAIVRWGHEGRWVSVEWFSCE